MGAEACRRGAIRDRAQAGSGDPMATDSSVVISSRNADTEMEKNGFRGNSENTEIVCNICKRHHVMKLGCVELQASEE